MRTIIVQFDELGLERDDGKSCGSFTARPSGPSEQQDALASCEDRASMCTSLASNPEA